MKQITDVEIGLRVQMQVLNDDQLFNCLYKDALTGAYNRRAYNHVYSYKYHKSLAIVDLDSLKWVNDNYGHRVGDSYIKRLVNRLSEQIAFDVYRLGGDEFALLSRLSDLGTKHVLEKVLEEFPAFCYGIGADLPKADEMLRKHKAHRENVGKRAPRGEKPRWTIRTKA